jgi:hypothetical protein
VPARLTIYLTRRAPRAVVLRDGEPLEIGRDPACGLALDDPRISSRHARLSWTGAGWRVQDLGSKNGTRVNGEPPGMAELKDDDWLNFGGLWGLFERLSAAEGARLEAERLARQQSFGEMRRRLGPALDPMDLLMRFLQLSMQVAEAERGFVLVSAPDGTLRPEVAAGFSVGDLWEDRFQGSVGAVKEVLESGGPVIISEALADPRLGKRPSVVKQGLWSIACLPLRYASGISGVLYMDSRKPGHRFTAQDAETLEILANHAAAVLSKSVAEGKLVGPLRPPNGGFISQLRQRLGSLLTPEGGTPPAAGPASDPVSD